MPLVTFGWELSEAAAERLFKMLCVPSGLEATKANAHAQLSEELKARVVAFERSQTSITPPVIP